MKHGPRRGLITVVLALALVAYISSAHQLASLPRSMQEDVLRVRLPPLLQVWQAGGDRYLAADLAVVRSALVGAHVTDGETYRIQAALQADAAILNPRHEDNYYIANAILPWQGYVSETQFILKRAAQARPWDAWPAFFYSFNLGYFERQHDEAARWAEEAASRSSDNANAFRALAAKWYERGDDTEHAIDMIQRIQRSTPDPRVQRLLSARIQRLEGLRALREAASTYQARFGKPPEQLQALVDSGLIIALPDDPLRLGYTLDTQGMPQLAVARNQLQ